MADVTHIRINGAEGRAPMRAGGRATEAGMAFQADVGTWIAAHILARLSIGGRFGINNSALPISVRLETGEGLDDIEVIQSDSGKIHLQSKTSATVATGEKAPLTKTVGQLAQYVADAMAGTGLPDLTRTVAILAVHARAPATLDRLETGLRAFDLGGAWSVTVEQRNAAERFALSAFETTARSAWHAHRGSDPADSDLVDMARIFRVRRFAMDEGSADWREASRILGQRVFGNEAAGDAPLRDLKAIVRNLIGNGAPADRPGLLRALRRLGHTDLASPDFAGDIARLSIAAHSELERLALHTRLPIDGGLALVRESDGSLDSAIQAGSMLVIGEPGAGKTGALVGAATRLLGAGGAVVFLSVDRFPGVAIAAHLQSELGLAHPLLDVLAAFPGGDRKILMIDALDAARGGPAEAVFTTLIEAVSNRLEDWTVIASIRTFDLRNGRRFRAAMAGAPPDPAHADPMLASICHFLVPRLSEKDLARLGAASPNLRDLFAAAPGTLHALLHNIFNLSLAAQLLSDCASPASFGAIRSQSGLIDAYEDERLSSTTLQQAAAGTVAEMAARSALAIRKVLVPHGSLDSIIQSGVLIEAGDLVSFTHHVLFDHIAGRFFLEWDDPSRLIAQVSGDSSRALMLAPALRFAVERLWRADQPGRSAAWALICAIFAAPSIDPVVANVALRTAVENVETRADIEGLVARIEMNPGSPGLATMLARLSRFVGIEIDAAGGVDTDHALVWATLAGAAIAPANRALSDPARFLLHTLFDRANLTDPTLLAVFGTAARALLAFTWDSEPPMPSTVTSAIRFTGISFASDPVASRALLDRILREPHFSTHADQEATWLAEQIIPIALSDPDFAAEIYRTLFTQQITDDGTSWFGGVPSRILSLSSNRRQDYQHCRWHLGGAIREFFQISVAHATRALIDATLGKRLGDGFAEEDGVAVVLDERTSFILADRDYSMKAWDEPDEDRPVQEDDMLAHFVTFLRAASVEAYRESVITAASARSSASVWSRILGVGAERAPDIRALLWPYATHSELLRHSDTMRDAVRLIAANYPDQDLTARREFETRGLAFDDFKDEYERAHWHRTLGRVLKLIPDTLIATDAMRALRAELERVDGLEHNTPLSSFKVTWGENSDYFREMLTSNGADLDNGPEGAVLAASDALHALVGQTTSKSDALALADLWSNTVALVDQLDAHADQLHDRISRSGWGHVSNAIERLADSAAYLPGEQSLPSLTELMALLDRLSVSPFPETKEMGE